MASVDFYYKNGQTKHFGPNIRVSGPYDTRSNRWLGKYYVWPAGKSYKGAKPIFSVSTDELHSKKSTGRKGCKISKY